MKYENCNKEYINEKRHVVKYVARLSAEVEILRCVELGEKKRRKDDLVKLQTL